MTVETFATAELNPQKRRQAVMFAADSVRKDADMIGWLPYQFYEHHDQAGTLLTCWRNGDLVGYCTWSISQREWGVIRAMQVWVREDARRIEHGRALVRHIAAAAEPLGGVWIQAWVASDLEANRFWRAIGFTPVEQRAGGGAASRRSDRLSTCYIRKIRPTNQTPARQSFCSANMTRSLA